VSTLSACGFQLRGNYLLPDEIVEMSLTSHDKYGELTRNVMEQLRLSNVKVVPPTEDLPNLHITSEWISEQTLSLYQNSQAAETELSYSVDYRITQPNIGIRTFSTSVTRTYLNNADTALAKSVERDLIMREMKEDAAIQIIRQMAQLKSEQQQDEPATEGDSAAKPKTP
jgi:LPS-assembly lipoprotein